MCDKRAFITVSRMNCVSGCYTRNDRDKKHHVSFFPKRKLKVCGNFLIQMFFCFKAVISFQCYLLTCKFKINIVV